MRVDPIPVYFKASVKMREMQNGISFCRDVWVLLDLVLLAKRPLTIAWLC